MHLDRLRHWRTPNMVQLQFQHHLMTTTVLPKVISTTRVVDFATRIPFLRRHSSVHQPLPRRSIARFSHTPPRSFHPASYQRFRNPRRVLFHTNCAVEMASDQDYASFLDKANQDTGASATAQSSKKFSTKSVNTAVPQGLEEVEEYYTSDADEPFEPVSLSYSGSAEIDAGELKKLLGHDSNVESVSEKQFGQYKKVVDAVKKAGNGKVGFFKVEHGGTRAEYYVVSVDETEGRLVGLKALAVES
ncbi:hypothetical protein B0J11DRAFT_531013 [Dendryphion nanum]|uniref:Uncharacterized protein n=1 Tax=Dendryphion nanum TaxID=256645 RepID=A0A9P9DMH8_9PLEO|nr:hypothetical protein B0J11DRAFT_531013 [Dendryphion nanum]